MPVSLLGSLGTPPTKTPLHGDQVAGVQALREMFGLAVGHTGHEEPEHLIPFIPLLHDERPPALGLRTLAVL
jgi:hypothetical protein